jgi:hypothetical protein
MTRILITNVGGSGRLFCDSQYGAGVFEGDAAYASWRNFHTGSGAFSVDWLGSELFARSFFQSNEE